MRILHTSDWHAGRLWKGMDRLSELVACFDQMAAFVRREQVDVVLVSGDVFDTGSPPAAAERAVFGFLREVGDAGAKSVVIAGNHDSADRVDAWGVLTELVGVRAVGRPRSISKGGLIRIDVPRSGETAMVAALPFASPGRLMSALDRVAEETRSRLRYATALRGLVEHLCGGFQAGAVNVLMAHTHLDGATFSGSERKVHLGDAWAARAEAIPAEASYVALGHIHRPQRVEAARAPTEYAGSPMQLDFGEEGETKSFVVVDVTPGLPAKVERIPYEGGRPLRSVRATLEQLEAESEALREAGWLRVTVPLETPDPDVAGRVRRLLPNVVSVMVDLPVADEVADPTRPEAGASPAELYRAYHRRAHGRAPDDTLVAAFEALYDGVEGA